MAVKGKCNCGEKATSEWMIRDKKTVWTIKLCENCKPTSPYNLKKMTLIS